MLANLIELESLNNTLLDTLVRVAMLDAEPEDVMPGGPGPWTQERQDQFRAYYRERFAGDEICLAIRCNGVVVGMVRVKKLAVGYEVGGWVGRTHRGRGIATAALGHLRNMGYEHLVAATTPQNAAALGVLRRHKAEFQENGKELLATVR